LDAVTSALKGKLPAGLCLSIIGTEGALEAVHLEWRFWKQIRTRYDALISDDLDEKLTGRKGTRAKGDRDYFLQIVTDVVNGKEVKAWRVSWRSKINWADRTHLLIDASARTEFVEVFYPEHELKFHPIEADLNMRVVVVADATYSPSSMELRDGDTEATARHNVRAAAKIEGVRALTATVCGWTGEGRVFIAAPLKTRKTLLRSWQRPKNLDSGHFGAQRGLDFAKFHKAAVIAGRTEQSIRVVDGLVAAMTADSEPEEPLDALGTGLDADGNPVMRQRLPNNVMLRNGFDFNLPTPKMPTAWGQLVDEQWREEEINQSMGRLRPVRRADTTTVYLVTSIIPNGLIVDRVCTLDDILETGGAEILQTARGTCQRQ
jgi:hypothetical protein